MSPVRPPKPKRLWEEVQALTIYTQEVQADQILPIGRIGNPEYVDHPKDHSLLGLRLPGYV